eukprot:snap_masked-scaffold69_size418775-processed-gene-3.20 protein:Tk03267 transcript:snap_masked-scaffold69_size418775-processed-gene-3.20-mRNA-1 annotation:"hypothetical protein Phum_PHUM604780"
MKSPVVKVGGATESDKDDLKSLTENGHHAQPESASRLPPEATSAKDTSNGVLPDKGSPRESGVVSQIMTQIDSRADDEASINDKSGVDTTTESPVIVPGDSSPEGKVNGASGHSPRASGDFRQMVFKQLLREDLKRNSAVNSDTESPAVLRKETLDDLKLSMTDILKNVISKSKSETQEAGFNVSNEEILKSLTSDLFQDSVKTILENFLQTKLENGCLVKDNEKKVSAPESSVKSASSSASTTGKAEKTSATSTTSSSAKANPLGVSSRQIDATVEDLLRSLQTDVMEETDLGSLSSEGETEIVTLAQLGKGMVPVDSVEIVEDVANGDEPSNLSFNIADIESYEGPSLSDKSSSKPSMNINIDRSKLFSQMEDKFAKETHHALKNKPVYRKRSLLSPDQLSENQSRALNADSPSPPVLTPANSGNLSDDKDEIVPKRLISSHISPSKSFKRSNSGGSKKVAESVEVEEQEAEDRGHSKGGDDQPPSLECQVPRPTAEVQIKGTPPSSPTAHLSSSELTKSLRKVRVRRSRNSSSGNANAESDGDSNLAPPILTLSTPNSEGDLHLSSGLSSPTRGVRPRLLVTPAKTPESLTPPLEERPMEYVSPLKIDIPAEEEPQPMSIDSSPSSESLEAMSKHRTLLMTPAASVGRLAVKPQLPFNPAVISKADAFHACFAVFERVPPTSAQPKVSPKLGSQDVTGSNGEVSGRGSSGLGTSPSSKAAAPAAGTKSSSTQPQMSLKTVIRLPKPMQNLNSTALPIVGGVGCSGSTGAVQPSNGGVSTVSSSSSLAHPTLKKKKGRKPGVSLSSDPDDNLDDDLDGAKPSKRAKTTNLSHSSVPPTQELTLDLDRYLAMEDMSDDDMSETTRESGSGSTGKHSPDLGNNLLQVKQDDKVSEFMVVPEKASSFNIHPGRCCSDVCHYCGMKFGMLDTPLHVSQLKTVEIQKFATEFASITTDACLCDKCFRYIDRTAKAKSNESVSADGKRKSSEERAERGRSCLIRNCNREVTSVVSKKWLVRLKRKLSRKVTLNWEKVTKSSAKSVHGMCHKHNALVESFTKCGLCKRQLTIGGICGLAMEKEEIRELNEMLQNDNIPADLYENVFVCKHCKTFCGIKKKAKEPDYLKNHKSHKAFYKDYRRKLHVHLGKEDGYLSESHSPKKINQVIQSDNPTKITIKTTTLDMTNERPSRKRKAKEFASPTSDAKIVVTTNFEEDKSNGDPAPSGKTNGPSSSSGPSSTTTLAEPINDKCSVNIQFDQSTKKLFQDLHHPYGNYTSFIRHLILLEKYWRNGDLALAESANQKASVYLKSVKNRIDAYEGKNKRSDEDLSESTRPDLSVPSAPDLPYVPPTEEEDEGSEADSTYTAKEASSTSPSQAGSRKDSTDSTILRIPKVPSSTAESPSALPTKIRVRTDLMHLGLMAKPPERNLMEERSQLKQQLQQPTTGSPRKESFKIEDLMGSSHSVRSPYLSADNNRSSSTQSSLLQMLNDPPVFKEKDNTGPLLGNTSLIGPASAKSRQIQTTTTAAKGSVHHQQQSSNSQLFKNSTDSGSSAIPLTFNNSIAEVLAATAAANAKKVEMMHGEQRSARGPDKSRRSDAGQVANWIVGDVTTTKKTASAATTTANSGFSQIKSSSPIGGSLSMQKVQKASIMTKAAAGSGSISNSGVSNIHPLMDMSKLLQTQKPSLPPHIVAQSSLPHGGGLTTSNPASASSSSKSARIIPKPGPLPQQVRPVQLGVGKTPPITTGPAVQGIQTVNKKSLNTVLDRLSGLKGVPAPVPTTPLGITSLGSGGGASSLVQQLNAPPMNKPPSTGSGSQCARTTASQAARGSANLTVRTTANQLARATTASIARSSPQVAQSTANANAAAANAALASSLFGGAFGGPMVGQPMVQYPWAANQSQQQQQQAAHAALILAMAGMPMSAAQEFMTMNLPQQERIMASLAGGTLPTSSAGQSRIRAPPPLTHMGRSGPSSGMPRPKKD